MENAKSESTKKDKDIKENNRCCEGTEGLSFNPEVIKFTDICTKDVRLTAFQKQHFLSFQYENIFFVKYTRVTPFTHIATGVGKEDGYQELNLSDACVTICNPAAKVPLLSFSAF